MAERDALAALVHDLRSPLAVIELYCGVLERDEGRLSADQRRDFSSRIRRAAAEIRDRLDRAQA